jgi:hypothetical protein
MHLAQLALDPRVGLLLTNIQMPGMSGYELAAGPTALAGAADRGDVGERRGVATATRSCGSLFHSRNWHMSLTLLGTKPQGVCGS